jgi:hypothetical protein
VSLSILQTVRAIMAAMRSEGRNVFGLYNSGILCSNSIRGMHTCGCVFLSVEASR